MDERVTTILEFDKVRSLLAERASFSLGKAKAMALQPSVVLRQVERWQGETEEALRLMEVAGPAPFGGLRDVRSYVRKAEIGGVLRPEELLEIAETIRCAERLRTFFARGARDEDEGDEGEPLAPTLQDVAETMGTFRRLEQEVRRCIDQEAQVVDHASPTLAQIRSKLRTARRRVREYLEGLVRSPRGQRYLQEPIVTLRAGRYVVPVKSEYRQEIPGIVHDQSASGATVFVEPMPVVELNNELRRVEREEEAEVERILTELSVLVMEDAAELVHTVEIAGELDFICAKANLAADWNCVRPELNDAGFLDIKRGRHPLLTGDVVPIDVHLGKDFTALIITGPNTGGKTVTLKTVGLFAMMAQAGLHLPADPGTQMCVFGSIYADIGDEQSIEQSLSTFSSHMGNIVSILKRVDARSLVLLDELGAGTDPTEGAALAIALLEAFCEQIGCRTVATTHYSELKSFAYSHPLCENASVEFDVKTLRPTYRLTIGVAGTSHAFAIARRLGLDPQIIERAHGQLSHDQRRMDDLMRSVEEDRTAAAKEREEAQKLRNQYHELRTMYHDAFERLKQARQQVLDEAKEEARELLHRTQREAEALLGALRKEGAAQREDAIAKERARVARSLSALATSTSAETRTPQEGSYPGAGAVPVSPSVGDQVYVRSLGQIGEVVQLLGDGKVGVQVGPMRVNVPIADLERRSGDAPKQSTRQATHAHLTFAKARDVRSEIDLRGLTVEETLEEVDKYLDDATLAGVNTVRIIHGKGTGALREAVHAFLDTDRRVSEYRLGEHGEGGSGVTVVKL